MRSSTTILDLEIVNNHSREALPIVLQTATILEMTRPRFSLFPDAEESSSVTSSSDDEQRLPSVETEGMPCDLLDVELPNQNMFHFRRSVYCPIALDVVRSPHDNDAAKDAAANEHASAKGPIRRRGATPPDVRGSAKGPIRRGDPAEPVEVPGPRRGRGRVEGSGCDERRWAR